MKNTLVNEIPVGSVWLEFVGWPDFSSCLLNVSPWLNPLGQARALGMCTCNWIWNQKWKTWIQILMDFVGYYFGYLVLFKSERVSNKTLKPIILYFIKKDLIWKYELIHETGASIPPYGSRFCGIGTVGIRIE